MTCGQLPIGGCHLELDHTGKCRPPDDRIIKYFLLDYDDPHGKWFTVTERQYGGRTPAEPPFWFVAGPNVEGTCYDFVKWEVGKGGLGTANHGFVVWAQNKIQVRTWVQNNGVTIRLETGHYANFEKRDDAMSSLARNRKIESAERTIRRAQEQIDRLLSLPEEPKASGDKPLVIFFEKRFDNRSKPYDYAAVKAGDGLWYTTGPLAPKGFRWDDLIEWIMDGSDDTVVYRAKRFDAI